MRLTLAFYVCSVPIGLDQRDGRASLGGSESACFGLARALARRGHVVHIHAQQLAPEAAGVDADGVTWHDAGPQDGALYDWCDVVEPDVFVSLRMAHVFRRAVRANYRILWNQDMLTGDPAAVVSHLWQIDALAYVSAYHRQQWEQACPDLARMPAYVTRNGFDPAHVPTGGAKVSGRICYITRPERGLAPLLQMWPALKAAVPHAELHVTRYQSMYDGEGSGVAQMCAEFDRKTAAVQAEVGGIVVHPGGLGKADLYRLIASSEVMWYPGVVDFAETSCIAAIEAQACGTVFVGSAKGALPETVPHGILLGGDASTPAYQSCSVAEVTRILTTVSDEVAHRTAEGLAHVATYTYDAIAQDWTDWLVESFSDRYHAHTPAVLRQLLQEDEHVGALLVARGIGDTAAEAFCARVIAGQDQTAEDYGARAMPDPLEEAAHSPRIRDAAARLIGRLAVLDVACGNGAFALALAQMDPRVRVVGLDYSAQNIASAREAAERAGVADRVTFRQAPVYDFAEDVSCLAAANPVTALPDGYGFDAAFCGEFLEHVANAPSLIRDLHAVLVPSARVLWTMPHGPWTELLPEGVPVKRGHVHHLTYADVQAFFGALPGLEIGVLPVGYTPRGTRCAHWVVSYFTPAEGDAPIGERDLLRRVMTTRPMPMLSVGMIVREGDRLELPRCLHTVRAIADEIVIGICGEGPRVQAIAEAAGATVVTLPDVADLPGGFGEARNRVLAACAGDWHLWIDADEQMVASAAVRQYLSSPYFAGYSVRQQHLQLDADRFYDEPVRLFRPSCGAQFVGVVHEQPQTSADGNADIWPTLAVTDMQIAHYGYLVEGVRRTKSQQRNLPLLVRDRAMFPDRRLGRVLWLREFSTWLLEIGAQRMTYAESIGALCRYYGTETIQQVVFEGRPIPTSGLALARFAAAYYEAYFPDPADLKAKLARPFYETALRVLPEAWQVDFTFAAAHGGLQGRRAKPSPFWTRSVADAEAMVRAAMAPLGAMMRPQPLYVEPYQPPADAVAVEMDGQALGGAIAAQMPEAVSV